MAKLKVAFDDLRSFMWSYARGQVGKTQFKCMACYGTGVDYGETCATCGALTIFESRPYGD